MRRVLKWVGYGFAGAIVLIVVAIAVFTITGRANYTETFTAPYEALVASTDSPAIVEGERLVAIHGCELCHGEGLSGDLFIDSRVFMKLPAPNLTPGQGGLDSSYALTDFERAVRHGVNREGRGLIIMPANDYAYLSDDEVVKLYAYVSSLSPIDSERVETRVGPVGNAILTLNDELRPVTGIDHSAVHPVGVNRADALALGEYRTRICLVCHGQELTGGRPAFSEDHQPSSPNLTPDPATGLTGWSEADFVHLMRTGLRPDGTQVDSLMPWHVFQRMTDQELSGVWAYLRNLPPMASTAPPGPG